MSWSISKVGTAEALKRALDAHSENMGNDPKGDPSANLSRFEFDHAKAHIKGLLDHAPAGIAYQLDGNGYGSYNYETKAFTPNNLSVTLKPLGPLAE